MVLGLKSAVLGRNPGLPRVAGRSGRTRGSPGFRAVSRIPAIVRASKHPGQGLLGPSGGLRVRTPPRPAPPPSRAGGSGKGPACCRCWMLNALECCCSTRSKHFSALYMTEDWTPSQRDRRFHAFDKAGRGKSNKTRMLWIRDFGRSGIRF